MTALVLAPSPAQLKQQFTWTGNLLLFRRDQAHHQTTEIVFFPIAGPKAVEEPCDPQSLLLHGETLMRQLDRLPVGTWSAGWLLVDDEHRDGRLWLCPADEETEHPMADAWLAAWYSGDDLWDGLFDEFEEPAPRTVSL